MEKNSCFVSLELTSSSVKLVTGFVLNDYVYILDMVQDNCSGLENGLIKNPDTVINSIRNVINHTSKNLNVVIKEVSLIIPPFNLLCMTDTGSTNTIDGNDVIRHVDTSNILTAMKKRVLSDPDLKIIDIVPDAYITDNNERFSKEPLGKVSKVLSLHASLYAMNNKVIHQFVNIVTKAGYEVKYSIISPYASALYLSTNNAIPDSYILVDIGHSITTISQIHNSTSVINSKMLKFGGKNITNAISEQFNISEEEAEELKCTYGIDSNPNFPVYIKNKIQLDDLSDCILGCLHPAVVKIQSVINDFKLTSNEKLPVVLIGGTSDLYNIERIFEDTLETKVINFTMETIGARDKALVATLGAIKYCDIQPINTDDDLISTSITRVDQQPVSKNYKFDEEL